MAQDEVEEMHSSCNLSAPPILLSTNAFAFLSCLYSTRSVFLRCRGTESECCRSAAWEAWP